MFKHILLAYDGSTHAQRAAELAGELARSQPGGADIRIVCAVDPVPMELGEPLYGRFTGERAAAGQELLEEARRLIGEGVELSTELLFGSAAEEVIKVALVRESDLIVMGSRGLGALKGLLLGSHTQKVVSHAPCPVLVVR
ncbi:MAG: universal stress protein [Chloroflexi bacterium]|nr:universal stress protein [Chloroflexota bacterium]